MARGDVADEQWVMIEPRLPIAVTGPVRDPRGYFNAVMWRYRTRGGFGLRPSSYDRFAARARQGFCQRSLEAVIAGAATRGEVDLGLVGVDSPSVWADHHAPGWSSMVSGWWPWRPPSKPKGIRRKGENRKTGMLKMSRTDRGLPPLAFVLTPGRAGSCRG